jgi:hypothetical protein
MGSEPRCKKLDSSDDNFTKKNVLQKLHDEVQKEYGRAGFLSTRYRNRQSLLVSVAYSLCWSSCSRTTAMLPKTRNVSKVRDSLR